ncbi:MAG: hypothetical protein KC550_02755 [Nanoarchaeota archaeon]|nr:hypothetical protein [Nanoarchaeota archaeon]
MTSYYEDNWKIYSDNRFNLIKFVKNLLNNNALVNGCGLICGLLSVLVVL